MQPLKPSKPTSIISIGIEHPSESSKNNEYVPLDKL